MAKQIKAIKCPHCGSVEKTKLDKDLYHCENCQTDYFLDNDDVNININHKTDDSSKKEFSDYAKNPLYIVGSIVSVLVIASFIISSLFSSSKPPVRTVVVTQPPVTRPTVTPTPVPTPEPKPNKYRVNQYMYYPMVTKNNNILLLSLHYRTYDRSGDTLNGYYFEVKDLSIIDPAKQIVKEQQIKAAGTKQYTSTYEDWDYRQFADGNVYLTLGQNKVFKLDQETFEFTDVTNTIFGNHSEFSSGFATINLAPWGYEDSLYLMTNNGKEYYYYPLADQVYDAFGTEIRTKFSQLDKARNESDEIYTRTSYIFAKDSAKDVTRLIKVVYDTKNISDKDKFGFSFPGKDGAPYKINFQWQEGPVHETKDLTPDRSYFNPGVVYTDKDTLIIRTKLNAAPNAVYNLQSLDPNTGEVKWTFRGDEKLNFTLLATMDTHKLYQHNVLVPYEKGYFLLLGYDKYLFLNKNGEKIRESQ
ncbi:hypothetical protein [Zophobihabitans entericus]|uniref:Uncharacterized protein n=1 Tax=Zophobihabitans entericus TaxID=1635327 RepID=A0A6G9IDR0_9GAMM|nr:hypothetical protein [Zophobihabitans entericus]QIQ21949.1 hypothetical protein IPMB12_09810 [Zophobihabitans entericus]